MANSPQNNDKFIDPIKKAGMDAAQSVLINAINEFSIYISKIVKDYINDIYNDSRKLKEKYDSISSLYRNRHSSTLEKLQAALTETEFIIEHTKRDLSKLNVYNPLHTAKYQILSKRLKEWSSLNDSMKLNLSLTLNYEVVEARVTKKESKFFNNLPDIQEKVLAIDSDEEYKQFHKDLKTYFIETANKDE